MKKPCCSEGQISSCQLQQNKVIHNEEKARVTQFSLRELFVEILFSLCYLIKAFSPSKQIYRALFTKKSDPLREPTSIILTEVRVVSQVCCCNFGFLKLLALEVFATQG